MKERRMRKTKLNGWACGVAAALALWASGPSWAGPGRIGDPRSGAYEPSSDCRLSRVPLKSRPCPDPRDSGKIMTVEETFDCNGRTRVSVVEMRLCEFKADPAEAAKAKPEVKAPASPMDKGKAEAPAGAGAAVKGQGGDKKR